MPQAARPLSPHIGIYRWQLTMVLSMLHRASGIALTAGTLLLIALLVALAAGPDPYARVQGFCASGIGMLLLIGWTWSLCFHLCNGVRHLAWDTGWGYEIRRSNLTGWIVAVASLAMTALIWACVFAQRGAA